MAESYNNYIGRGWTRHEAFEDILCRNPLRSEYRSGDIVVLNVRLNYNGNTYCYINKDDVYQPGDAGTLFRDESASDNVRNCRTDQFGF